MIILFKSLIIILVILGFFQFFVLDYFFSESWYLEVKKMLFVAMAILIGGIIISLFYLLLI